MAYRFRLISVTLFTLVVNSCLLWSVAVASSLTGCGGEIVAASNVQFEQQVVMLVNQARAEQGMPPLKYNPTLTNAARYLAQDMAQDDYFAHDTYDRTDDQLVRVCKWSERVQKYYVGSLAENVAVGFPSPASVVQGWLGSQGHRANILNNYQEIGVGYYNAHWVQDFGTQSDVYPLIINSEAITTASLDVTLYVYGTWDSMRLRNNDGAWSAWQPFQNQVAWRLDSAGVHTVEVELQNAVMTVSSEDEIEVVDVADKDDSHVRTAITLLFLPILTSTK